MNRKSLWVALILTLAASAALALVIATPQPPTSQTAKAETELTSYVQYLANAGVLVVHGETKIAFDPIFRSGFGTYLLLSEELEKNLFAGLAPFDGLDAIFISHSHPDHFSVKDVLALLERHPTLKVFAPKQATDALRRLHEAAAKRSSGGSPDSNVLDRIFPVALEYGQDPVSIESDGLLVEAVRIPHSGWPDRMMEIENIAFRVSLLGESDGPGLTTTHLGDADARAEHFEPYTDYWTKRPLDLALPPYWYLQSEDGQAILTTRLRPALTVGVHVPKEFSSEEKQALTSKAKNVSLFTEPLETRDLEGNAAETGIER